MERSRSRVNWSRHNPIKSLWPQLKTDVHNMLYNQVWKTLFFTYLYLNSSKNSQTFAAATPVEGSINTLFIYYLRLLLFSLCLFCISRVGQGKNRLHTMYWRHGSHLFSICQRCSIEKLMSARSGVGLFEKDFVVTAKNSQSRARISIYSTW